jgi:hypothetical protein
MSLAQAGTTAEEENGPAVDADAVTKAAQSNAGLFGAELKALDADEAMRLIGWLRGEEGADSPLDFEPEHAVLQCALSLVWAVREGAGWRLASHYWDEKRFPMAPSEVNRLHEARVFGPEAEALIWRDGDGFRGRVLRDGAVAPDDPRAPLDRIAPFLPSEHHPREENAFGREEPNRDKTVTEFAPGFVVRQLGNGRTTVTPPGRGVALREYLSEDGGALRIAATRFVWVEDKKTEGDR